MDRHTELINWVCSIFDNDHTVGTLNRECGYLEFRPEPVIKLRSNDKTKTPDIVALNPPRKIVLIIEGKGGIEPGLKGDLPLKEDMTAHKTQLREYTDIDLLSLKKYFTNFDENSQFEVIAVTFEDSYPDFKPLEGALQNLPFWICNLAKKHIRKVSGTHLDKKLERISANSPYISLSYSESTPHYIYFSRNSPKKEWICEALTRLLIFCTTSQDYELDDKKIDDILMNKLSPQPSSMIPMLWQFSQDERLTKVRQVIGTALEKRWMKEVKKGIYRFLKQDGELIDENLRYSSQRTLLTQFRQYAKG